MTKSYLDQYYDGLTPAEKAEVDAEYERLCRHESGLELKHKQFDEMADALRQMAESNKK